MYHEDNGCDYNESSNVLILATIASNNNNGYRNQHDKETANLILISPW